jgi:hypothetical protein
VRATEELPSSRRPNATSIFDAYKPPRRRCAPRVWDTPTLIDPFERRSPRARSLRIVRMIAPNHCGGATSTYTRSHARKREGLGHVSILPHGARPPGTNRPAVHDHHPVMLPPRFAVEPWPCGRHRDRGTTRSNPHDPGHIASASARRAGRGEERVVEEGEARTQSPASRRTSLRVLAAFQ